MKTLKFLLAFFVVMTFFALNSYSQGKKVASWCDDPIPYVGISFPNIDETITGYEQTCHTVWVSKYQEKTKGTFTGDETGTIYYFSYVFNYDFSESTPGFTHGGKTTACLEDEFGHVYYVYHENGHQTTNANGVMTVDKSNEFQVFY